MKPFKIYLILTLSLIIQWAVIQLFKIHPTIAENWYSLTIYPLASKLLRLFFGWIPISIGDLFYIALIVIFIFSIKSVVQHFKQSKIVVLFKILAILALINLVFNMNWGYNYLRKPVTKLFAISNNVYNNDELINFTKKLINKTNEIQFKITANDSIVVFNKAKNTTIKNRAVSAIKTLKNDYPFLNYKFASVKNSLFSLPLTYMGFAGYLNPFTNEAQVNYLIPKNSLPMTTCHEIAHQTGIASESGANFVGYLATTHSTDLYFQYSGYTTALRYCLYEISQNDEQAYNSLIKTIHIGILKDFKNSDQFWKSYQNWSEKYFKLFYSNFLKFNQQKDGIKEYNKLVFLLINYYHSHTL